MKWVEEVLEETRDYKLVRGRMAGYEVVAKMYPHGKYADLKVTDEVCRLFGYSSFAEALYDAGAHSDEIRRGTAREWWVRVDGYGNFTTPTTDGR